MKLFKNVKEAKADQAACYDNSKSIRAKHGFGAVFVKKIKRNLIQKFTMSKINLGIIGASSIADEHLKVIDKINKIPIERYKGSEIII